MPREESPYAVDWLRIAEKDLGRVERMLKTTIPRWRDFAFSKGVEKFLKAFLLSKGWQLRRIHDLEALLDDAMAFDPGLAGFRELCQKISAFYLVERYPLIATTRITEQDVRTSLEQAEGLVNTLRAGMHRE
ncbi:hypothetical protein CLG94_04895 [Candidatus Methylomirabilis limnetica]|uniref:HEPN domain-containing protein n=1 Tax=Candidatus Methylomirabilis limnetica TaxID=2033718 RepID=A0A2T4TZ28_9BACT|nr:hypothetical protein CLG94_04895 [Candidatus Methylomirabilis limnetica]